MSDDLHPQRSAPHPRSPWPIVFGMLVVIAVFFALREHWEHLAGFWAYGLLLLCPLMHLFGHGHGYHHHGSHGRGDRPPGD